MKKIRTSLAAILALALVLSTFSFGMISVSAAAFQDTEGHWASEAIDKWSGYGVIQGSEGNFRPGDYITRAETATVLNNVIGYTDAAENTFNDVEAGAWYADAVLKANKAGVMNGDGEGIMRPTANVSREETVVMISRAVGLPTSNTGAGQFGDEGQISDWAKNQVNAMASSGYIQGNDGNFRPKDAITRAEVVTILNNLVGLYLPEAGTYDGTVQGIVVVKTGGTTLQGVTAKGVVVSPQVGNGTVNINSCNISGNLTVLAPSATVNKNSSVINSETNPTATAKPNTPSYNGGGSSGGGGGSSSTSTYRVLLDANGGLIRGSSTYSRDITRNRTFGSIEDPVRDGYTFTNWYTSKSAANNNDEKSVWYLAKNFVTKNMTLYAGWEADVTKTYTVTFESNGGTEVDSIEDVEHNSAIKAPTDPTRANWTFDGWYAKQDFSGSKYNFSSKVTESFTLYAKWVLKDEGNEKNVVNVVKDSNLKDAKVHAYPATALPNETIRIELTPYDSGVQLSKPSITYAVKDGNDVAIPDADITKVADGVYSFIVPKEAAGATFTVNATVLTTYTVKVETPTNGTASADKEKAAEGDTVTITLTPADNYEVDTVIIKQGETVIDNTIADGKATFVMPKGNVTVTVTFKEKATIADVTFSVSTATDLFGKSASDLMADVAIDDNKVTGTLKYVTGYTGYWPDSAENQEGNYLALDLTLPADVADPSKAVVIYKSSAADSIEKTYNKFTAEDKVLTTVWRVADKANTLTYTVDYDGEGTEFAPKTYTIDLNGLTLAEKQPTVE